MLVHPIHQISLPMGDNISVIYHFPPYLSDTQLKYIDRNLSLLLMWGWKW